MSSFGVSHTSSHRMSRLLLFALLALGLRPASFATHLCGGELRYTHIGGLTYGIEVRLFVNSMEPQDVPEMILAYGDGSVDTITVHDDLYLAGGCCDQLRIYVGQHTFSGPGIYTPSVIARNRVAGVVNVQGSVDVPICIGAVLVVIPELTNASPEFMNHAVFSYFNGDVLTHELQPFDADGDSLYFELVEPNGDECAPIAGYMFPNEVVTGPYSAAVNSSGVFQWDAPQLAGFYTIAIRCTEWRAGEMIGTVTRDMMLCVSPSFTSVPEADKPSLAVIQPSLDGPVSIRINDGTDSMIDILEVRGALVRRLRQTASMTSVTTDGMSPGIYFVKVTDAAGAITTDRFVVAR